MTKISYDASGAKGGFSLAELLIAIVILGVLASVSVGTGMEMQRRNQVNSIAVNLSGWIEEVRRSSQRGVGCTVSIGGSSLGPNSVLATSDATSGSTTTITDANACMKLDSLKVPSSYANQRSSFTVTSTSFSFTPRGTIAYSSGNSANIIITQAGNSSSRCLRISGLLGFLEISKSNTCNSQELF